MRILVAEDDADLLSALVEVLKLAGYEAHGVLDGAAALIAWREQPAHLLVSDVLMPGKDGLELLMAVREECPGAKLLVISGGGWLESRRYLDMAAALGADRVLAKPFQLSEFLETVNELATQSN